MPRKPDGPLRDIIAKLHYNHTKEQLLQASRQRENLTFQGHDYQLFADLSQSTITRAFQPHLQVLQHQQITYTWGFPFSLRFTDQGRKYSCKTTEELKGLFQDLHLASPSTLASQSHRRHSASCSPQKATTSSSTSSKRGRFASPYQAHLDSMD